MAASLKLKSSPVVIGGGPTGLTSAIMLARRGYSNIKVLDRLAEPAHPDDTSIWGNFDRERSYNIGISGRGQNTLRQFGLMDIVDKYSSDVMGRKDWPPGTAPEDAKEVVYTGKSYVTKCIQRDRLASVLLQEIRDSYADKVTVEFDTKCTHAQWRLSEQEDGDNKVGAEVCEVTLVGKEGQSVRIFVELFNISFSLFAMVVISPTSIKHNQHTNTHLNNNISITFKRTLESSFVIGADGAQSAIRDAMEVVGEGGFKVERYEDKNVRVYRTIPLFFPAEEDEDKDKDGNNVNEHEELKGEDKDKGKGEKKRKWREDLNYRYVDGGVHASDGGRCHPSIRGDIFVYDT